MSARDSGSAATGTRRGALCVNTEIHVLSGERGDQSVSLVHRDMRDDIIVAIVFLICAVFLTDVQVQIFYYILIDFYGVTLWRPPFSFLHSCGFCKHGCLSPAIPE